MKLHFALKGFLFFCLVLVFNFEMMAQDRGTVQLKYWGLSLTIPNGWSGMANGNSYVLSADDQLGMVLIWQHQSTNLNTLQSEIMNGLDEGDDLRLAVVNGLQSNGSNQIGGFVSGTMMGAASKGYLVGMINSMGNGIGILAITNTEYYDGPTYEKLGKGLAASVRFSVPAAPQDGQAWKNALSGSVLRYFETYSGSYGSGGYASEARIDLCSNGRCKFNSQSSLSVSGGSMGGNSSGNTAGIGTWKVEADIAGNPILTLSLENGLQQFALSEIGSKVGLNGTPFTRTTAQDGAQHGPVCN